MQLGHSTAVISVITGLYTLTIITQSIPSGCEGLCGLNLKPVALLKVHFAGC